MKKIAKAVVEARKKADKARAKYLKALELGVIDWGDYFKAWKASEQEYGKAAAEEVMAGRMTVSEALEYTGI